MRHRASREDIHLKARLNRGFDLLHAEDFGLDPSLPHGLELGKFSMIRSIPLEYKSAAFV